VSAQKLKRRPKDVYECRSDFLRVILVLGPEKGDVEVQEM